VAVGHEHAVVVDALAGVERDRPAGRAHGTIGRDRLDRRDRRLEADEVVVPMSPRV
jgi:hypothetical protein